MSDEELSPIHCNKCREITHFKLVEDHCQRVAYQPFHRPPLPEPRHLKYDLMQCQKCGLDFAFLLVYEGKQSVFPRRGNLPEGVMEYLPENIYQLYVQAGDAYNDEAYELAVIACRAIIEAIFKQIDANNAIWNVFERIKRTSSRVQDALECLQGLSAITQNQYQALLSFAFITEKENRDLKNVDAIDVAHCMHIIEAMLRDIYELPRDMRQNQIRKAGISNTKTQAKTAAVSNP